MHFRFIASKAILSKKELVLIKPSLYMDNGLEWAVLPHQQHQGEKELNVSVVLFISKLVIL